MQKYKVFLVLSIFIFCITGLRLVWHSLYPKSEYIHFEKGVLQLDEDNFISDQSVHLNGKWSFYPNMHIAPNKIDTYSSHANREYIDFPSGWKQFLEGDSYKYGTFHLKIKVSDKSDGTVFGMRITRIPSASKVFINEKLVGQSGMPSEVESEYVAQRMPYTIEFSPENGEIDIVMHVAHGGYTIQSVEGDAIEFGTNDVIKKVNTISIISQVVVIVVFSILAIYSFLLFIISKYKKIFLYFTLLLLNACLLIFLDIDKILLYFIPLSFEQTVKIGFINLTLLMLFLTLFFKHLLPKYTNSKLILLYVIISLVNIFFVLLAPLSIFLEWRLSQLFVLLLPSLLITKQLITVTLDRMRDVIFLLLSAAAITNNILWASVYHRTEVRHIFYPGDLLLTIFFFSTFWLIQFVRNTKEVEKLSNELILADKRKDEFLANTSHELRSPLHSIINIAYSILNSTNNQIEQKDKNDLELIVTVGRRMSYMVNDLLDLARIKENRLRIHRKKTNLPSVLSSTVQMIEYLIKDKEVIIINNVPLHTPYVYADESRLAQIFMNLIHNAVKYTKKGQIEIAVEKVDGNHLCVRVSDTGIGMDSEQLTSIFQPYEQLNVSSSGGLGLGLTITKQLIEMHDGKINVTSSVGKGTTFEFTLPMFEEQEEFILLENDQIEMLNSIFSPTVRETAVVLEKESTKQLDTKMKLLLIDDESINLHVLTRILSDEAFEITTTTRAVEALQLVKTHQWDLIICDVMMPEMNGYELTKEIRTIYNLYELPILLLTAKSTPEEVNNGFVVGANDYIIKPVEPLELKARVTVLMELKRAVLDRLSMEAAWLHAQIKPHFFFNTLNSILYLIDEDREKMEYALEQFTEFVQTTFDLNKMDHYVPLAQELRLVKSYLEIEKIRFGNRLEVEWDVNYQSSIVIPPLTIQTLVENAINHGLMVRNKPGKITVKIKENAENVLVMIKDDGVGMSREKVETLTTNKHENNGVGLYNTNRRLKQMFNTELQISSEEHEGTTIIFQLPLQ